ncbi:hypothetical protein RDn1_222 [Candidatus Termititenax dinenymphae]|uniref:Integral membrane protein n=1 Tax=Candidatus Termititenax dinenymphae TaxID=2218523 RepID=A0A388TJT3_9BACT|nr:hypothetical protein RDn1_222 [Candidatus Termititenax dinenymphae]
MADNKFSIGDSFAYGIEKTKKFFWPTIGIYLLLVICQSALIGLYGFALYINVLLGIIAWLALFLFDYVISIGWIKTALAVLSGKKPEFKYFTWDNLKYFWTYLGTNILISLIVIAGTILLIIPGIVWTLTYAFAPILVIDQKLSVTKALAASRQIVTGQRWNVFVWYLAIGVFNFVGMLLLGIGLLFTIPVTFFATSYVYGKLAGKEIK